MGYQPLGPFPKALTRKNYLIVAIDYVTRWIEGKALASITARKVKEFFYEDIICRFRIPKILYLTMANKLIPKNSAIFVKN